MTARSAGASAAIIETNISTHVTVKNTAIYGVRLCGWGRGKESTVKPAVDMTLLCMYLRSIILPSIALYVAGYAFAGDFASHTLPPSVYIDLIMILYQP